MLFGHLCLHVIEQKNIQHQQPVCALDQLEGTIEDDLCHAPFTFGVQPGVIGEKLDVVHRTQRCCNADSGRQGLERMVKAVAQNKGQQRHRNAFHHQIH
jgi:hypothetical protein